jgi:hypothetical protein
MSSEALDAAGCEGAGTVEEADSNRGSSGAIFKRDGSPTPGFEDIWSA